MTVQNREALINTREAARLLGLCPGTLEKARLTGSGNLRFFRVGPGGRAVRYRLSDIDELIALSERSSTSDTGGKSRAA